MQEIAALTPIYAGVSHTRLIAGEQLHWPVPAPDHPGTTHIPITRVLWNCAEQLSLDQLIQPGIILA